MSLSDDGRLITCDGEGCDATTTAPGASPRANFVAGDTSIDAISDWLFVLSDQNEHRHYCPRCAPAFLNGLF